jgi:hypothetical protein
MKLLFPRNPMIKQLTVWKSIGKHRVLVRFKN